VPLQSYVLGGTAADRDCPLELRVPDDLATMSFDDTPVAAMASPPISAVRQPFEELGREATRVLLSVAEGRPPASPRIELATELVLRASTAAPPGA
jgi:DNA-binding LacI/PurR family transcriptional regulator